MPNALCFVKTIIAMILFAFDSTNQANFIRPHHQPATKGTLKSIGHLFRWLILHCSSAHQALNQQILINDFWSEQRDIVNRWRPQCAMNDWHYWFSAQNSFNKSEHCNNVTTTYMIYLSDISISSLSPHTHTPLDPTRPSYTTIKIIAHRMKPRNGTILYY